MALTRRTALAGGGALLAATALQARPGTAQTAPHRFRVGAAEVTVLTDGMLSAPLSWVLPDRARNDVDAVLNAAGRPAGDITLQVNVLIVRLGAELILVDSGAGPDFAPVRGKLADNLASAGIAPEAITRVVFTHAHPDHLWGVVDPLDGGSLFTRARHHMCAAERDYWLKPGIETEVPEAVRGSALGTQRRLKDLGERIETFKAGAEIVPGLSAFDTAGHTAGHVSLVLTSGSEQLVIGGDALIEPAISFAAPDWRWGADWDQDMAVATRKRLLDRLATEKLALVGYHLPWPGLGRVERTSRAYRFVQA